LTTVAQLIADALAQLGVRWAFTVPGESFLPLLDALPAAGVNVVATRHEGGASFMAEAIGQFTGKPAAVLGTRAVGAANMAIGIHTARANSTPMVALVGQVQRDHQGREAFQEADLVATPGRLAKSAGQLDDPTRAAQLVGEGLTAMVSGRRGPVLLALPEDVLDVHTEPVSEPIEPIRITAPTADHVRSVVELLDNAQRPAILAGYGVVVAGAVEQLIHFSERLNVPVFAAWRRPAAFPNDHPSFLGTTGYGSPTLVRKRLAESDALLVIGCRLNEVASFDYAIPAPTTHWAHVDLEPRTTGAGLAEPDIALAADAGEFLWQALAMPIANAHRRLDALHSDRAAFVEATRLPIREWHGPGVDPAHVVAVLQGALAEDAVITTDAGNFGLWPARYFKFGRKHGFLGPTSGAMGYGLPAAIAASLAAPERQVVALCGDGGLAMTMNEIETAVRTGAKPVILVFDNERYGTIAMHQSREQRTEVATGLGPIDFVAIARACGAEGVHVSTNSQFEPALRAALARRGPTVIDLDVDSRWVSPDQGPA
jgi:acetolactate synthase-1/2/3 large subunit